MCIYVYSLQHEYRLGNYAAVRQDESLFLPPLHMKCDDFGAIPSGPTAGGGGDRAPATPFHNPLKDLISHFPQGAVMRKDEFNLFEVQYSRGGSYKDAGERVVRESIFHMNQRYINASNRQGKTYTLAVNHLADRTKEERSALLGSKWSSNKHSANHGSNLRKGYFTMDDVPDHICGKYSPSSASNGTSLPDSIDWRKDPRGYVISSSLCFA